MSSLRGKIHFGESKTGFGLRKNWKGEKTMELFLMQLFNGISVSSILLLAALGLAITFGLMGVINMAHGEFIMIGAYTAYVVQNFFKKVSSGIGV